MKNCFFCWELLGSEVHNRLPTGCASLRVGGPHAAVDGGVNSWRAFYVSFSKNVPFPISSRQLTILDFWLFWIFANFFVIFLHFFDDFASFFDWYQFCPPESEMLKYIFGIFSEYLAASAASPDYVRFQAVIKSAASAASRDYVRFQAVIKSAASAASPRGGRASGRLDHNFLCFSMFFAVLAAQQI